MANFGDTFTRSDGPLGDLESPSGLAWVQPGTAFTISGNRAMCAANAGNAGSAYIDVGSSVQTAQVDVTPGTANGNVGIELLGNAAGDVLLVRFEGSGNLVGRSFVGGTQVALANYGFSAPAGAAQTIRGVTDGSTATIYLNGTAVLTFAAGSLPSGSRVALYSGDSAPAYFDNFTASTTPPALVAGTVTAGTPTSTTVPLTIAGFSGGTAPYTYQIQVAPDANGSAGTFANFGPAGTATNPVESGLNPQTKYWFRPVATDAGSPQQSVTGPAVSATTAPLVLPSPPTISVVTSNGYDQISYTPGSPGTYPDASYSLFSGTTSGAEGSQGLASNPASAAKVFSNPVGGFFYVVKAIDAQGNVSAASNEDQGGPATELTLAQMQGLLNNLETKLIADQVAPFTALMTQVLTSHDATRDQQDPTAAIALVGAGLAANAGFLAAVAALITPAVVAAIPQFVAALPTPAQILAVIKADPLFTAEDTFLRGVYHYTTSATSTDTLAGPTLTSWTVYFHPGTTQEHFRFPTSGGKLQIIFATTPTQAAA